LYPLTTSQHTFEQDLCCREKVLFWFQSFANFWLVEK
jgi:hypothetical protein